MRAKTVTDSVQFQLPFKRKSITPQIFRTDSFIRAFSKKIFAHYRTHIQYDDFNIIL